MRLALCVNVDRPPTEPPLVKWRKTHWDFSRRRGRDQYGSLAYRFRDSVVFNSCDLLLFIIYEVRLSPPSRFSAANRKIGERILAERVRISKNRNFTQLHADVIVSSVCFKSTRTACRYYYFFFFLSLFFLFSLLLFIWLSSLSLGRCFAVRKRHLPLIDCVVCAMLFFGLTFR